MITLSPEQEEQIVRNATEELVRNLISNHGSDIWLTKYQAAGILDCSPQTVMDNLPHYDLTAKGGSVRFLLSEVNEELKTRKVKAKRRRAA